MDAAPGSTSAPPPPGGRPGRARRPAVVAVAVGLVVVLALWYVAAGPGSSRGGPAGSVVVAADGDADLTTEPFEVRRGWSISWETEGPHFEFAIRGDTDIGTVINEDGPANGITSPVPAGSFRLEITADGPWRIEVRQGD
jgi:hypothetical protein